MSEVKVTLTMQELDKIREEARFQLLEELQTMERESAKLRYRKYMAATPEKRQEWREYYRRRYYEKQGRPVPERKLPLSDERGRPRQIVFDNLTDLEALSLK